MASRAHRSRKVRRKTGHVSKHRHIRNRGQRIRRRVHRTTAGIHPGSARVRRRGGTSARRKPSARHRPAARRKPSARRRTVHRPRVHHKPSHRVQRARHRPAAPRHRHRMARLQARHKTQLPPRSTLTASNYLSMF